MNGLKRFFTACNRMNRRADVWIVVGVLLAFIVFDSIPLAAAVGVAVWLAFRTRSRPQA